MMRSLFYLFVCFSLIAPFAHSLAMGEDEPADAQRQADQWGEVVDPDGDCKFRFSKGKLTISVPDSVHGMSVERGRVNAPRVWEDASGDFVATVKVTGQFPKGAQSLVASRKAYHGAGLIAWQDDYTYVRLERAEMVAGTKNVSFTSFELRQDGRWLRAGNSEEHPLRPELPTWLRLERRGTTILAAVSQDGEKWTDLKGFESPLGKQLKVGVMAGHNTTSVFDAQFEGFDLAGGK